MGVLDLFKTNTERSESRKKETLARREAAVTKRALPPGPVAATPAATPSAGATENAVVSLPPSARRRSRADNPALPAPALPSGAIVVTAPDGRIAEFPWEPLRAESVLGPIMAGVETPPELGLVADERGILLRTISPDSAVEERLRYELGDRICTTLVVRDWPRDNPTPALWGALYTELAKIVPEISVSMHHWRIGVIAATKELKLQIDKRELELKELLETVGADDVRAVRAAEQITAMRSSLSAVVRSQETLFHVSAYLRICAPSNEELAEQIRSVEEVARTMGLSVMRSPGEQRDCFISSMPYASDPAYYTRLRGSAAAATLMPLINRTHQERNVGKNPVVLYGIHMANSTPVLASPWNANETIEITTVLGRMGSGKSYWVRTHLGRLAMAGVQTITIDPLGDFVRWHAANEATIIEIAPGSKYHVNPLKRSWSAQDDAPEPIEQKVEHLLPMFRLVLGEDYDNIAAGLLQGGLRAFYERYEGEEHLMSDFVQLLRNYNRSSAGEFGADTMRRREKLIDTLALKCLDGTFKEFFSHPTNIDIDSRNPAARRILFNLKPSGDGELMVFASFMAMTMAANIAQGSMERKILLIDELHRLFLASRMAGGIEDILRSFVRIHRHWNAAMTFATQWVDEEETNAAQAAILKATGTWVLLRATDSMLEQSARLIGRTADLDLMRRVLRISGATAEETRRSAKPMIVYRAGEAIPMYSVGLSFEDAEDDKASGVRMVGTE